MQITIHKFETGISSVYCPLWQKGKPLDSCMKCLHHEGNNELYGVSCSYNYSYVISSVWKGD